MKESLIPYLLVFFAFVVALPFMSSSSTPTTGMLTSSAQVNTGAISASFANGHVFVQAKADLIYSKGRYYDYVSGAWKEFSFSSHEEWLKNSAAVSFSASGLRSGSNFIAVYSCDQGSEWKCSGWKTASFDVP